VEAALQKQDGAPKQLRIVLLADKKDHKVNEHDYPLWQERWALLLGGRAASDAGQVNLFGPAIAHQNATAGAEYVTVVRAQGWPTEEQFASADVVVAFCYLAWNDERKQQLRRYLDRGGGLVIIHSATWTRPKADPEVAALVGVGGFTRYRHGPMQLEIVASGHPICKGLPKQIPFLDEPYWPPTPAPDRSRVTALAVSQELDPVTQEPSAQPMFWVCETGRGRVFGCVPGHYIWTFDDPWFRALLLRGIAWAGGGPVYRFDPLVLRGGRVADN
jgi:type 1 glutamine amidotransferase